VSSKNGQAVYVSQLKVMPLTYWVLSVAAFPLMQFKRPTYGKVTSKHTQILVNQYSFPGAVYCWSRVQKLPSSGLYINFTLYPTSNLQYFIRRAKTGT
jgi:hypothetical protein